MNSGEDTKAFRVLGKYNGPFSSPSFPALFTFFNVRNGKSSKLSTAAAAHKWDTGAVAAGRKGEVRVPGKEGRSQGKKESTGGREMRLGQDPGPTFDVAQ